MRDRSPLIEAHYQQRLGRYARLLVWITAKDRATGTPETIGLWTGDDHATFIIDGQPRVYYGAGEVIEIEPLVLRTGLRSRSQRMVLSGIAPGVEAAIRQYEPRLAPVEMHIADFDPVTGNLIDVPERVFRGTIDTAKVTTPENGGEATVTVELLGAAESLRRTLALKKSDETLQARAPGDRFRRYADVSGVVSTPWGEARAAAPKPTVPTGPQEPVVNDHGSIVYPGP